MRVYRAAIHLALALGLVCVFALGIVIAASDPPPPWAYGFAGPASDQASPPPPATPAAAPVTDDTPRHVPGSTQSFTLAQMRATPPDWYPNDHPPMPPIVATGRRDAKITPCSLCHYPNGKGRPENAPVAGLPKDYFIHTMQDFKNGLRKSSDPRKGNTKMMVTFANAMTDDEIAASAEYFSSMKWTPWIRVVETDTVPKTRIAGGMFLRLDGNDTEPLGNRIIETPENVEATEVLRDSHAAFIAYVPPGSVKRGEPLVTAGGGGKTIVCTICHGSDLQGLGPVPGIAGRSPSYLVRQLYDIQQGNRQGAGTELMKAVVAKLSTDDMISIVAYLASRPVATQPIQAKDNQAADSAGK